MVAPAPRVSAAVALALSPQGRLHVVPLVDEEDGLTAAERAALAAAFARGEGHGVLHLGAVELPAGLHASLALFRDLGRLFVGRLCAIADLEEQRARVVVTAPPDELARLAAAAPPMIGGEYVDAATLGALWTAALAAFRAEIAAFSGTVEEWLAARDPVWNLCGRVCFHLAENRGDDERPFAFLATYTTRAARQTKVQHRPLEQALAESQRKDDRQALLSLLKPVHRAAAESEVLAALVASGDVFHALAWTPAEAHRFLRDLPKLEASGVIVRVPDWWKARRPTRLEVGVTIGARPPAQLGMDALLDFQVALTLDGEQITAQEWRELLAGTEGLTLIRGRWVELDREKLRAVLEHWQTAQRTAARDGLSFLDGMRLLAGASGAAAGGADAAPADAEWSRVVAGDWLASVLAGLRSPEGRAADDPGALLRAQLRPYQQTGVTWLRHATTLGFGACLADDMGLGKTVQVLALLLVRKRAAAAAAAAAAAKTPAAPAAAPPSLLVVPASLIGNWLAEIERFAPSLTTLVAHPSAIPSRELAELPAARLAGVDLVITTYGAAHRLSWLPATTFDLLILDEAQAIKNPGAKQTRAVKALRARARIALTGTPVENRLGDLWSLFDFLNPGLLGSAKEFGRFVKQLAARPSEPYAPLRTLIRPYLLRRLKSDKRIVADLPDKTELTAWCGLDKAQAALYQRAVDELAASLAQAKAGADSGIRRRGVVLAYLLRFKQICNHPSQWLGDDNWDPAASGKFARLAELAEEIAARQEKVLVFTQFKTMTAPLATFLGRVFGRPGLVLHGETPVAKRKGLVDRFQQDDDVPFFVLSVKAGGTGLNLTAAAHVIHFDRWWNPAVEDQATDRAYRIGQQRNVLVHKFVCRGTIEEKIDGMLTAKQGLSRELLAGGGEAVLTELPDAELMQLVRLDIHRAMQEG